MIRIRTESPEIGCGKCTILEVESPHVLALRYDWRGNSVLTIHNFDRSPQEIELDPGVEGGERLSNLLEDDELICPEGEPHRIALHAHDYRWYRVGGLDYAADPGG